MSSELLVPPYVTIVNRQETTDGTSCYVAYHPELPTCLGQGDTPEEAKEDLAEAIVLVIEHLVAQGLPIPRAQTSMLISQSYLTDNFESVQETVSAPTAVRQTVFAGF